jgi:hypothetical protein
MNGLHRGLVAAGGEAAVPAQLNRSRFASSVQT